MVVIYGEFQQAFDRGFLVIDSEFRVKTQFQLKKMARNWKHTALSNVLSQKWISLWENIPNTIFMKVRKKTKISDSEIQDQFKLTIKPSNAIVPMASSKNRLLSSQCWLFCFCCWKLLAHAINAIRNEEIFLNVDENLEFHLRQQFQSFPTDWYSILIISMIQ